ncbi:MAG: prepilin-type N-terminal cleavage/methylation domain-containing protein [Myxococcota bacterium]
MRRGGFTLIEVMAAVAILSVALLSLVRANNQTLLLKARAQDITTATLLARARLADLSIDPESIEEESEGDFGEQFPNWRWTLSREDVAIPFDYAGLPPIETISSTETAEGMGGREPAARDPEDTPQLLKLTLTVLWPAGASEGELAIVEYLAPEAAEATEPAPRRLNPVREPSPAGGAGAEGAT